MKKTILTLVTLAILGLSNAYSQVGIGTTSPDASSILDVDVTTLAANAKKGFLPPRMTTAQRNAINGGAPAEGLTIFNTDAKCLQWFDGAFWYDACTGEITATPNGNLTVASPTYQGVSVINTQGIGYNGETVPAGSTITVLLSNSSADPQNYGLIATDPATGLEYSATGTIAGSASGVSVVLNHNEPAIAWDFYGTITMALEGTSSTLNLTPRIDIKSIPATETVVNPVTYGTQTWMDRNLGARRVATAMDDVLSYGNHYQWGRPADGHEITVWNGATPTSGRGFHDATVLEALATSDTPGHPNFILTNVAPFDWLAIQADPDRWESANQGPCPAGYHVPTNTEWNTADTFGAWNNNTDTFNSALKLPSAGGRSRINGLLNSQGTLGVYWSSTVSSANALGLSFTSTAAGTSNHTRASGWTVRCLKD